MKVSIDINRNCIEEPLFADTVQKVPNTVKSAVCDDGRVFPAQSTKGGAIIIVTAKKGEELDLTLSDNPVSECTEIVVNEKACSLDIFIKDKKFSSYVYSDEFAKPFLGPILGKNDVGYTRLDLASKEHPHQRSLIIAVGDVNGYDFWNEPKGEGIEVHKKLENIVSGSAFSSFTAHNIWKTKSSENIIDESRTFTFYNQSENCRYVDIEVVFTASYSDITFGATKEAGPLGIRMNENLKVTNGGKMINSYGGEGERECWGRPAHWCDYSGVIDGNEYGIAVFDSELNLRYPTTWHIRNYGLFAANNLFFNGAIEIPKGETLTYRHRVVFHSDGFLETVSDRFVLYADKEKANL
ncbi:MAG TPA: PmoA family protein [Oscillospiraceae bacterium]|nr:PmoA family protein [Oscillospiraceae bacterium]